MKRDLNQLADRRFDVLIVGGGIYGAAIAREAAVSGLETALIEKEDFCHATSASSLKILHGGLRYLQDLDFSRMRASIRSQKEFMRTAPELTAPLGCIIPTYGYGLRGRLPMRIALCLNDLVSLDRRYEFQDGRKRGRGRIVSKGDYSRIVSVEGDSKVSGAALWYDALVQDTERLAIALIHEAHEYGACIANYVKAKKLNIKEGTVVGVLVADALGGGEFEVAASHVVNATGPWLEKTFKPFFRGNGESPRLARGLNIVVKKRLFQEDAVGLEGSDSRFDKESILRGRKRFYFFVPWRGHTMIGTAYDLYEGDPDRFRVERQDIEDFVSEVNVIYPPAEVSFEDVSTFHAGLLPAAARKAGKPDDVQPAKHGEVIEHAKHCGPKGLLSVRSVKYTTAPHVAKQVLKKMDVRNGGERRRIRNERFTDGAKGDANEDVRGCKSIDAIAPELKTYLESKYGKYAVGIRNLIVEDPELASWISTEPPLLCGEVRFAIREEMAVRLSDVVLRRTGFGNAGCPSKPKLEAVADIMAVELGWDDDQKSGEIESMLKSYHPLAVTGE